ncbi:MAG: molybdopterin-dependent oxidoreductase [Syntrophobacteraceae bacterium]
MEKDLKISRRTLLAAAGGALINIGFPGIFTRLSKAGQSALAAEKRLDGRLRLPPGQVAVQKIEYMGGTPGTATVANWSMRIHGEVEKPAIFSFQDLLNLPQVDITCDIHCVTGWSLLDSQWSGVALETILERVKPGKNEAFVIFQAAAGYTSNVPIAVARQKNSILAHRFYGERLPRELGAPVRVVIPDLYFYKSAKWLEAIKVASEDEPGFWERRGYSNAADPWKEERYSRDR